MHNFLKRISSVPFLLAVGVCLGAVAPVCGQQRFEDPVFATQLDLRTVFDRLQVAERRIQELESQLRIHEYQIGHTDFQQSGLPNNDNSAANGSVTRRLLILEDVFEGLENSKKLFIFPGHAGATMKVTGRVHVDYWASPDESPGVNAFETGDPATTPQDRFNFRRLRFGVRGTIKDNMEYRVEMEFGGGNNSEFRDAWLGFNGLPFLQTVLIGNQKRPYGLAHLNSSRFSVFMERAFIVESLNQDARRLGIQSYGVSEDLAYNWRFGVFNQRLIQDEGRYISDHPQAQIAGRFANTIWYDECSGGRGYAHWAISGTVAKPDGSVAADPNPLGSDRSVNEARFRHRPEARTVNRWLDSGVIAGADWYQILGLESVLNVGALQIVGEYMNLFVQREDVPVDDLRFHGGYIYVGYFLTGEHIPWNLRSGTLGRVRPFENFFMVRNCDDGIDSGWGAWQVAVRYSYADLTNEDITGGIGESVTFGLNWHWNAYARMQINYIYGEIKERGPVAGQTEGDYQILGTRFMVDF